jgi:hypothetical protein
MSWLTTVCRFHRIFAGEGLRLHGMGGKTQALGGGAGAEGVPSNGEAQAAGSPQSCRWRKETGRRLV